MNKGYNLFFYYVDNSQKYLALSLDLVVVTNCKVLGGLPKEWILPHHKHNLIAFLHDNYQNGISAKIKANNSHTLT